MIARAVKLAFVAANLICYQTSEPSVATCVTYGVYWGNMTREKGDTLADNFMNILAAHLALGGLSSWRG